MAADSATQLGMTRARIVRCGVSACEATTDALAVEEPLEIRLAFYHQGELVERSLSITMRTPGHDRELAAGFLLAEGLVHDPVQLASVRPCGPSGNVVRAELAPNVSVDWKRLERHFYTTSSCGVCGKSSLEALNVESRLPLAAGRPVLAPALLRQLPERLREVQGVFDRTGGLHASALFDPAGELLGVREDVGRHNALDKLIGSMLLQGHPPLRDTVLLVSGRASFELVQKALVAGIPVLAAVGAPSSLAVELAKAGGMTLLGFMREGRFNVYAGPERVEGLHAAMLDGLHPGLETHD